MTAWISKLPQSLDGLPMVLTLLGGFGVLFFLIGLWARRRFDPNGVGCLSGDLAKQANLAVQLPFFATALPFLLLVLLTVHLPLSNPAPVFGMALLFATLLLGLARALSNAALPGIALGAVFMVEFTWHILYHRLAHPASSLAWYLGFYALFSVFPFLFHRHFAEKTTPWAAAALSGPAHFVLVYLLAKSAWPHFPPGLIPAAFALPALAGLAVLLKRTPAASPARLSQLAWFGGVALLFITLIFPIQLDREWLTVGWALEGAALCWLFHRVPHPGLRATGFGLLVTAFARLVLNPAVLHYHPRSETPLWNWYLYTYGLAALSCFAAGRLLAPPRNRIDEINAQPVLYAFGTILAFLLINIEIADFFSTPGDPVLTFKFFGNFARDMTYSIAWALFALVLLVVGIRQKVAAVRYASLALLGVTVAKLFFHDLSQLQQLYRIGAFLVVAVIAIVASFLYQRFVVVEKEEEF